MQDRKPYVTTKHFQVKLFDKHGIEIHKDKERMYAIEYTEYQDTVDVLPYFIHDDKLYIVITESLKPALLLRPQVAKSIEGIAEDNNNGYILEQPSAVILTKKSEYSISDAINRIFKEKLPGLTPLSPPSILGGSYFPSVGTSTEIVFPRAVRVKPDISYFYTIPYAKAYVIEAQEVCTLYFEHKREVSTRLIELIYRLADDISYKISAPLTKGEQINYSFDSIFRKERFVDKATVRNLIEAPSLKDSTVARVVVSETEKPRVPFLHTTRFRTECIKTDGTSGTSEVDVLVRKNVDSIDVGGYFLCEGKAYMPIKWGVRPALSVRNLMPHPIHTDTSVYFIEGVAGSFEGESTKADLLNRGIIETEEEVSLTNSGTAIYIGYDYPSPGHNIERVYRMLLSLDPTREVLRQRDEEETLRIVYVSVEDIIELAHEGTIRDLRLSLNAHCVQSLLQDTEYKIRPYERKKEDQLFEELVNQPSDVQKWLSENSGQVDEILSESSLYRKLKSYGESELGVAVMELHHEKESSFFSPMVPLFAIPDTNQKDKIPFYYLHDLFHYATTGFVPLVKTDNSGELSICSFEEYMKAVAGNECEAVWYSDVLIPEEFGIDRAEQIFNGDSVARAFAELGIEKSESREIIREIELYGRIPEEVRTHQLFGRFKNVFIGRLLRYHVMDTDNSKSMYAYWAEHLDIAKVMEDFCDVFSSVEEYEKYYSKTVKNILLYTEGVNPLRAYLSRLLNVKIRLLALKFSYVRHEVDLLGLRETVIAVDGILENMKCSYKEITENKSKLLSIDPTETNKAVISHAYNIEQGIVQEAEKYLEKISNDDSIPEEVRDSLKNRTVPFFEPFRDIDPEFLKSELLRLQKENQV